MVSLLDFPRFIQEACDESKQLFRGVKSHGPMRRDVFDAAFETPSIDIGIGAKLYDERSFVLPSLLHR